MLKRLRIKFVCIIMAIVTAMLCLMFGLVMRVTYVDLEEQSVHMMRAIADNPLPPMRPGMGRPGQQVQLPFFVVELGADGEVIDTRGGYYDLSDGDFLRDVVARSLQEGGETGILDEYSLRYYHSTNPRGEYLVFADRSSEVETMNSLVRNCVQIGGASFLVFLILSLLLSNWAVRPVERAWVQQRQFVADASHELKTPLTVIMTNAELLRSPGLDEGEKSQFGEHILVMCKQMRGLVESLLELARVDSGGDERTFEEVDLSGLTANGVLPFEALFFERDLELDTCIEPGIRVKGNGGQLRQTLEILLDNAQKYAVPHTRVELALKRVGRNCLLTVENRGETIPPEELEHLFERFYRGDKARSMNCSYGLGLSIAAEIVSRHRGKIWAESNGGIIRFFVQLPVV